MEGNYIPLEKLEVYIHAREYSRLSWSVYDAMSWQVRKFIGDQMITSVDSVGANIAEGYGRFHYLDKNKFYYNARGSLFESKHWFDLLLERRLLDQSKHGQLIAVYKQIEIKLNALIRATRGLSYTHQ